MTENEKIDNYNLHINGVVVSVKISRDIQKTVPLYEIEILNISKTTQVILDRLRQEFIRKINIGKNRIEEHAGDIQDRFKEEIRILLGKYFPNIDARTTDLLMNHILQQNIGLDDIEILLHDPNLEEVAVNSAQEPVWVFHRKYGWLVTNIVPPNENRIRHYATVIGREVGKEITVLNPLMDAHTGVGSRVNATLMPISTKGNTLTIRKFAERPWTITDMLLSKTMNYETAAWLWLGIHFELSILITGGTSSGKTSTLNAIANFFPPNHRILSIEDTRELTLPKTLHWVPMETRLPNPEGKGEVTMLDLVVNALRMRPDRIIVGEIRRQREAEVLFEAMHTGHSVYGTLHANSAQETVARLTNPPINVPKSLLPAIGFLLVQQRNRRTGYRRVLQLAEINEQGDPHILMQLDQTKDDIKPIAAPDTILKTLNLYSGMTEQDVQEMLKNKISILKQMVKRDLKDIHQIGLIMSKYYRDHMTL